LTGTSLPHRFTASPNFEARKNGVSPNILLLHYTDMASAELARQWLCASESRVSCHYLIDEAGQITQMVNEDMRAWHAGASSWRGMDDINSGSIGIEVHNIGHKAGYPAFPDVQMRCVIALCQDICKRHEIRPERVLAHSDVAPGRKIDPGEKFDWRLLHEHGVGHWVAPVAIGGGVFLQEGDQGDAVAALQTALKLYGYGIEVTGWFDMHCRQVVEAFQRHFRPARVDGVADQSTIETLFRLAGSVPLAGSLSSSGTV
jgi:N-acetylmuramoyl-L-alanine amidase